MYILCKLVNISPCVTEKHSVAPGPDTSTITDELLTLCTTAGLHCHSLCLLLAGSE